MVQIYYLIAFTELYYVNYYRHYRYVALSPLLHITSHCYSIITFLCNGILQNLFNAYIAFFYVNICM